MHHPVRVWLAYIFIVKNPTHASIRRLSGFTCSMITFHKSVSRYYVSLLQKEEATPIGMESDIDHLRGLAQEYGNIHVAWDHAIRHKMYEDIDKVLDNAWLIYAIKGWFQEGIEQTLRLAQSIQESAKTHNEKMLLARALMSANGFLAWAGELVEAKRLFEDSTEILRSVGDTEYLSNVLIAHGKVLCVIGKVSRAHEIIGEGIQLANQDKKDWVLGLGDVNHGYVFAEEGNYIRAHELIPSGLSLYKKIKNFTGSHLRLILLVSSSSNWNDLMKPLSLWMKIWP